MKVVRHKTNQLYKFEQSIKVYHIVNKHKPITYPKYVMDIIREIDPPIYHDRIVNSGLDLHVAPERVEALIAAVREYWDTGTFPYEHD